MSSNVMDKHNHVMFRSTCVKMEAYPSWLSSSCCHAGGRTSQRNWRSLWYNRFPLLLSLSLGQRSPWWASVTCWSGTYCVIFGTCDSFSDNSDHSCWNLSTFGYMSCYPSTRTLAVLANKKKGLCQVPTKQSFVVDQETEPEHPAPLCCGLPTVRLTKRVVTWKMPIRYAVIELALLLSERKTFPGPLMWNHCRHCPSWRPAVGLRQRRRWWDLGHNERVRTRSQRLVTQCILVRRGNRIPTSCGCFGSFSPEGIQRMHHCCWSCRWGLRPFSQWERVWGRDAQPVVSSTPRRVALHSGGSSKNHPCGQFPPGLLQTCRICLPEWFCCNSPDSHANYCINIPNQMRLSA